VYGKVRTVLKIWLPLPLQRQVTDDVFVWNRSTSTTPSFFRDIRECTTQVSQHEKRKTAKYRRLTCMFPRSEQELRQCADQHGALCVRLLFFAFMFKVLRRFPSQQSVLVSMPDAASCAAECRRVTRSLIYRETLLTAFPSPASYRTTENARCVTFLREFLRKSTQLTHFAFFAENVSYSSPHGVQRHLTGIGY
jgi:hypothetical protein